MQRFSDALAIQQGACNPSGIARSLVKACDEAREAGVQASADPAVRLIVHQLAHLCRVDEINNDLDVYPQLIRLCEGASTIAALDLPRVLSGAKK